MSIRKSTVNIQLSPFVKIGLTSVALVGLLTACAATPAATSTPEATETASAAAAPAAWSYDGANGPDNWATLDPAYATCADGSAQSPIDITGPAATDLKNIAFSYTAGEAGIFNNGHTVEAEPLTEGENSIELDGVSYPFLQFHFHAPSEHEVNGERFPLEVHFVHKTEDGKIAVVGILVKEGEANAAWQTFVEKIAAATEDPEATVTELDWSTLLPAVQTTYRYDGSLTTPGCSEGVKWNVMTESITMSAEQIAAFVGAYPNNSRPVQPLDGRAIAQDSTPNE